MRMLRNHKRVHVLSAASANPAVIPPCPPEDVQAQMVSKPLERELAWRSSCYRREAHSTQVGFGLQQCRGRGLSKEKTHVTLEETWGK